MSNTKHTPTPWQVAPTQAREIYALDVGVVARPNGSNFYQMAANAAFIVRAVNAHEALVEALANITQIAEIWGEHTGAYFNQSAIREASAALKLAKGEE